MCDRQRVERRTSLPDRRESFPLEPLVTVLVREELPDGAGARRKGYRNTFLCGGRRTFGGLLGSGLRRSSDGNQSASERQSSFHFK
jgi:hypothetical protein